MCFKSIFYSIAIWPQCETLTVMSVMVSCHCVHYKYPDCRQGHCWKAMIQSVLRARMVLQPDIAFYGFGGKLDMNGLGLCSTGRTEIMVACKHCKFSLTVLSGCRQFLQWLSPQNQEQLGAWPEESTFYNNFSFSVLSFFFPLPFFFII